MHCPRFGAFLALFFASTAAAFTPLTQRTEDRPWTPARETGRPEDRLGWSPKPTGAPAPPPPRFGEMDLLRRDFTMGTDTCGFVSTSTSVSGFSSIPVTCVKSSAYCTNDGGGNMDCCTGAYTDCTSSMFSACLDYSASSRGACANKGLRTICCWEQSPSCYTLIYSTTASPNKVFSILQCQSSGGLDTLLATPQALMTTSSSSSSSSSSTTSSTSSTGPTITITDGGGSGSSDSSTPVGAIVGGVVGGIAVLGLSAFLIFFLIIRSRRNASNNSPAMPVTAAAAATQPPSTITTPHPNPDKLQSPHAGYPSASQPFPQQPQYPGGEYKPYDQAPQAPQPGYPQPGYGPPPGTYGYANAMPGQGYPQPYGQGAAYPPPGPQGQVPAVNELPVNYVIGSEGHRAELGPR